MKKEVDFCDVCGKTARTFETEIGNLCNDCDDEYRRELEEDMRNDPDRYCRECGRYSDVLDAGKCPMCFELDGYTLN